MFPGACYWKLEARKQCRYTAIFHKAYDSNKCDDQIGRDAAW